MKLGERILAGAAGVVSIAGGAHVNIMATGGYGHDAAIIAGVIALGVIVGATTVPSTWLAGHRAIAVFMAVGLLCGEAAALLATAERVIAGRDAKQTPLRAAIERHHAARRALDAAQGLQAEPTPSARLDEAVRRLAAAEAEVRKSAAEKGCRENCARLLQASVDAAGADVAAARRAVANHERIERERLGVRVEAARQALDRSPLPTASATPLADRLHVAPWVVDVVSAVLISVAVNGLGAAFLAAAAHGRRRERIIGAAPIEPLSMPSQPSMPRPKALPMLADQRDSKVEADRFARATFRPAPEGRVRLREIKHAYTSWCASRGLDPLPDREIGGALNSLFVGVGLQPDGVGSEAAIIGIAWAQAGVVIEQKRAAA